MICDMCLAWLGRANGWSMPGSFNAPNERLGRLGWMGGALVAAKCLGVVSNDVFCYTPFPILWQGINSQLFFVKHVITSAS